jgi:uncharacterized membrane protein (DUF485 family)
MTNRPSGAGMKPSGLPLASQRGKKHREALYLFEKAKTSSKEDSMAKSVHDIVNSAKFKKLVKTRWTVSFILTFLLFVVYYGYILLIAYNKEFLAEKVGVYTNYGILLGVLVIVLAWVLTLIYVVWANFSYDKRVEELKEEIR